jgi:hypothetical protein
VLQLVLLCYTPVFLAAILLTASPIPRIASYCPPNYQLAGAYCVPTTERNAIPRTNSYCPPNYKLAGAYCAENDL